MATKRMSSITLSRSARAVASDRTGLYMLKKHSGTRNENACASIAKKRSRGSVQVQGSTPPINKKSRIEETERRTHPKS